MIRQLPPQVDQVKNWCLANRKFEDANFIMFVKELMKNNQQLTLDQAIRLNHLLRLYILDIDLIEKIKERKSWWRR